MAENDKKTGNDKNTILNVKDLCIEFTLRGQVLKAIRKCSLELYEGETLAIVGESGSGKSVFTKSFMGMLDKNGSITGGSIEFEGQDLAQIKSEKEWLKIRGGKIAMVMQDPMTALNPLRKIGSQIQESIELHQNLHGAEAKAEVIRMLELVDIPDPEKRYGQYPHELSGGMRQRVVIAIAIACHPKILICDEPTTALDVTVQAQILELLTRLQKELQMTMIYITHDLGVVADVADRVAVMYAGQFVEVGTVKEVFFDPQHPYMWALLGALPQLGEKGQPLPSISGTPPTLYEDIKGDAFAPRNPYALEIDSLEEPPIFQVSPTHWAKTWNLDPRAPKIERPEILSRIKNVTPDYATNAEEHKANTGDPLVEVKNVDISFGKGRKKFVAVKNADFSIYKGETFALVGESGSGKTTIGRAILRINPVEKGEIRYRGERISGKIPKERDESLIRNCQMIFQDPMASLNERAKVDYIVSEGLYNFHLYKDEADREQKVANALSEMGLIPEYANRFPHEFSGGQRQRIGIARALIMNPEFVIADEPISALDVSIRAQVLNLMNELKKEHNLTYLFIAHDLSVVRFISDRVAVICKGRIVEMADTEELFQHPLHPYTKSLLSAVPVPNPDVERNKVRVKFNYDSLEYKNQDAEWTEVRDGHYVYGNEAELERYREELSR